MTTTAAAAPPATAAPRATAAALSARTRGLGSSAIRDLLSLVEAPGIISLAGGLPAAEHFPATRLAESAARLLVEEPGRVLQYAPTEGRADLRRWIAAREGTLVGRCVDADDVLVTSGSQQALLLLALALCDPGDSVVVDDPGYVGGLQALAVAGADVVPVPVDEAGLDVEHLAGLLRGGLRPVACYTVATFQNPTGATLAVERRRHLAELADHYGFVVIDDDPYRHLWFDSPPPAPLTAFTCEHSVHLGSASKVIAPGLRCGWVVAPPVLRTALVRLKQAADLQAPTLGQALLVDLLGDDSWFGEHLSALRSTYAIRAGALCDALEDRLGDRIAVRRPSGGLFVWARFTDGTDTQALLGTAIAYGVGFVPGEAFSNSPADRSCLRLSFATNAPDVLVEAVDRLVRAADELVVARP